MTASYWDNVLQHRTLSRRRALAIASTGLTGAALLAACGGDDAGGGGGTGATTKTEGRVDFTPSSGSPVYGGRFQHTGGAENFNAVTQWSEGTNLSGIFVYDRPLTSREDTRRFVLEAVESAELRDPLTLVMKLRPGTVYANLAPVNGRGVEAEDIVATQRYEKDVPNAFDKTFVNSFLERAEAVDKQTVIYHLKRPAAYLFGGQLLGSGTGQVIIPRETIGPQLDSALQVGSGPFIPDSGNRPFVHYIYKQSPTYWGRKQNPALPYIGEHEITYILDKSAQEAAFYGGQLDYFVPSPVQMRTAKGQLPTAFPHERPGFSSTNFSFNMWPERNLPWRTDVRVREAIWRLVNRNELLTRGYEGAGQVPVGLLPSSLKPYQVDPKDVEQYVKNDVQKAKQLLSAANWDFNKEYRIQTRASGDVLENVALVTQAMLRQADFKTVITPVGPAFFARLQDKDWDLMYETPPGNDTPGQQLRTQHSASWSDVYRGFALYDPEVDRLIEKSEETIDYEENRKMVIDIQKLCMSKFTASWEVVTHNYLFILSPRVQNFELTLVQQAMKHFTWLKG